MRSLVLVAATSVAALVPAGLASTAGPAGRTSPGPRPAEAPAAGVAVHHRPPVDGPVVDGFRPPASPFGPGNRGIDYRTEEGSPVRASADGVVDFAGPVGGRLHVVIRHADGVRTSYSFLASIAVHAGSGWRAAPRWERRAGRSTSAPEEPTPTSTHSACSPGHARGCTSSPTGRPRRPLTGPNRP